MDDNHFPGVQRLYVNEKVRRHLGGTRTNKEINSMFSSMKKCKNGLYWGVHEKTSHRFIGLVSITPHHDNDDQEISYQFLPEWWGSGYATEVIKQMIDYAFNELQITKLIAETQIANIASCKLLQRVGMMHKTTITRYGAKQAIYYIIAP